MTSYSGSVSGIVLTRHSFITGLTPAKKSFKNDKISQKCLCRDTFQKCGPAAEFEFSVVTNTLLTVMLTDAKIMPKGLESG